MTGGRLAYGLAASWLVALAACERADFESLGWFTVRDASAPQVDHDAGSLPSTPEAPAMPRAELDAGTVVSARAGSSAAAAGVAGVAGVAGGGGAASEDDAGVADAGGGSDELHGSVDTTPFAAVEAGYVIGRSDELGVTTVYLIDMAVTCAEISSFFWLASMPSQVQAIELSFASSAAPGAPLSSSIVSYARGGMYGFQKSRASTHTLILSQNTPGGVVEGTLEATLGAGRVSGSFHADFCANGVSF